MYFQSGLNTFDVLALEKAAAASALAFPLVFMAWAVFPPQLGSGWSRGCTNGRFQVLAGVEMKVALAALRVAIELLPEGARYWALGILILATIHSYGAAIAMVQKDFKYVIGFSSLHMGLVMIGFATLNRQGRRTTCRCFWHGVMTATFFAVVGMVYDRARPGISTPWRGCSRRCLSPGWHSSSPGWSCRGFSGFVAEFPSTFMGASQAQPWVAIVGDVGCDHHHSYSPAGHQQGVFGDIKPELNSLVGDVTILDNE